MICSEGIPLGEERTAKFGEESTVAKAIFNFQFLVCNEFSMFNL